jgi:hypothetical protein
MRARLLLGCALVLVLGCGSRKFAPVSGKVTLNGKPLADATVNFQPIAKEGSIEAGVGSAGKTNADGEFTLKTSTGEDGAVVGNHRVMITVLAPEVGQGDERPPRGGWPLKDTIPARYNNQTKLTFEVKADGGNKADFPLTSP